jgi:signal transduction histidine kinase
LNALTEHARPADGEELSLFDVSAGLESTLRLLSESIRNKQLVVTKEFHTHRPIAARPRQLNQVFLNLLDNAIRASPIGGHLFLTLTETDRDTISLVVRDEGTGIPLDEQDRIFDPFFTTREPGEGTGLGLYLSRKILESHEGSLRVASRPGQGASFLLELPCTTPPALALERKGLAESRRAP